MKAFLSRTKFLTAVQAYIIIKLKQAFVEGNVDLNPVAIDLLMTIPCGPG